MVFDGKINLGSPQNMSHVFGFAIYCPIAEMGVRLNEETTHPKRHHVGKMLLSEG